MNADVSSTACVCVCVPVQTNRIQCNYMVLAYPKPLPPTCCTDIIAVSLPPIIGTMKGISASRWLNVLAGVLFVTGAFILFRSGIIGASYLMIFKYAIGKHVWN